MAPKGAVVVAVFFFYFTKSEHYQLIFITIEGVWNAVKKKLKRMYGTFKHQLPSNTLQSFILCTKLLGLATTKTVPLGTTKIKQKSMTNL